MDNLQNGSSVQIGISLNNGVSTK